MSLFKSWEMNNFINGVVRAAELSREYPESFLRECVEEEMRRFLDVRQLSVVATPDFYREKFPEGDEGFKAYAKQGLGNLVVDMAIDIDKMEVVEEGYPKGSKKIRMELLVLSSLGKGHPRKFPLPSVKVPPTSLGNGRKK